MPEFELTKKQHDELLVSCSPIRMMKIGGHWPKSPQENANAAWRRLGEELGFDPMTVQPVPGKSSIYFTATLTKEKDDGENETA